MTVSPWAVYKKEGLTAYVVWLFIVGLHERDTNKVFIEVRSGKADY